MLSVVSSPARRDNRGMAGLGSLVRDRRLRLGWTQADLADRVSTSAQHISQIETGARKWPREIVPVLADALGLSQVGMAVAAGLIEPPAEAQNPVALVDPRVQVIVEGLARLSDRELSHVLAVLDFLDGGNHGANTARQPVAPRTSRPIRSPLPAGHALQVRHKPGFIVKVVSVCPCASSPPRRHRCPWVLVRAASRSGSLRPTAMRRRAQP